MKRPVIRRCIVLTSFFLCGFVALCADTVGRSAPTFAAKPQAAPLQPLNATAVYGQPDFTSNTDYDLANSFDLPSDVVFDASGGMYIADEWNNRVLYYPAGSLTPSRVYGQPDFSTANSVNRLHVPESVSLAHDGGIYIADTQNNRVLYYPAGSTTATRIYGTNTLTDPPTSSTLDFPCGVAEDSAGGVYITSGTSSSVVNYYPPGSVSPDPSRSLTTVDGHQRLGFVVNIKIATNGDRYLVNSSDNRVLVYPAGSLVATRVYGQPNLSTTTRNTGGISASSLNNPAGLALTPTGDIYISDYQNNRVLYYPAGSTTATRVYGQPDFTTTATNAGNVSATTLNGPNGLSIAPNGDVAVADSSNNRVVIYTGSSTTATRVYGQPTLTHTGYNNYSNDHSLRRPQSVVAAPNGDMYVADTGNNRVVFYPAGSMTATRVYGQLDFMHNDKPTTPGPTTLLEPSSVALDPGGGLYVAEPANNRVLYFPAGSTTATRVYGQPDFTTASPNTGGVSATSLKYPTSIAISSSGEVYIADSQNSRILRYPSGSTTANAVYGQNSLNTISSYATVTNITQIALNAAGDLLVSGYASSGLTIFRAGSTTPIYSYDNRYMIGGLDYGSYPPYGLSGVTVSANGDVYTADGNNEVLYYPAGSSVATRLYGRQSFLYTPTRNVGGVSSHSLAVPMQLAPMANGDVLVADAGNNRVLRYAALAPGPATQLAFSTLQTGGRAGVPLSTQPAVTVLDARGNRVTTYSGTATLSLVGNTGATLGGTLSVPITNGSATFSSISLDKTGKTYKFVAYSGALGSTTSNSFDIFSNPTGFRLGYGVPSARVNSPFTVSASVIDSDGNIVTDYSDSVTVSVSAGPNGATLGGTTSRLVMNGSVGFDDLTLDMPGTGYTLTLTAAGLTALQLSPIEVLPRATHLVFGALPSRFVAGNYSGATLTLEARDDAGTLITSATGQVTLTMKSGPSGAHFYASTNWLTNGKAIISIYADKFGSYVLTSQSPNYPPTDSDPFDAIFAATNLRFTTQPVAGANGATLSTQPVVAAVDYMGNVDPNFSGAISLSLDKSSGTLGGTTTLQAVNGVATFTDLTLSGTGDHSIIATTDSFPYPTYSQNVHIDGVTPTRLLFSYSPYNLTVNLPPPTYGPTTISVVDASGVLTPQYNGMVGLAIKPGTGTAGATLQGTTSAQAVNGQATFNAYAIDKAGSGYVLVATAPGVSSVESQSFTVYNPSFFLTTDSQFGSLGARVNTTIGPIHIAVYGVYSTMQNYSGNLSLSLISASGATLHGTTTRPYVNGVATFDDLSIDQIGQYTLTLTDSTSGYSAPYVTLIIWGDAVALKPTYYKNSVTTIADTLFAAGITVQAQDAKGNRVGDYAQPVNLSLATGTPDAVLRGATSLTPSPLSDVSFNAVAIDRPGTYTFNVSSGGLTATIPETVTVWERATRIAFTTQPPNTYERQTFPLALTAYDADGNVATHFNETLDVSIAHLGDSPIQLGSTVFVNGQAAFTAGSVATAGTGYTIVATTPSLSSESQPFSVAVVTPQRVGTCPVSSPPPNTTIDSGITVCLQVEDSAGRLAYYDGVLTATVTAAPPGGLSATAFTVFAHDGFAQFSTPVNAVGDYSITFSSDGLTATAVTLTVKAGAPTHLGFSTQPTNTSIGRAIHAVAGGLDRLGNVTPLPYYSPNWVSNESFVRATDGTTTNIGSYVAPDGTLHFDQAYIGQGGTGYVLVAGVYGLRGESQPFDVSATGSHIQVDAVALHAGDVFHPTASITDDNGNLLTDFIAPLKLELGQQPQGAYLFPFGVSYVAPTGGIAHFSDDYTIYLAGDYTLVVSNYLSMTDIRGESPVFSVSHTAPSYAVLTTYPANILVNSAFSVTAEVRDTYGNPVPEYVGTFSVRLETYTSGANGHLTGQTTRQASNGSAIFPDLTIDEPGFYGLVVHASDVANDNGFSISVAGPALHLVFQQQPGGAFAGQPLAPQPVIAVADDNNGVITNYSGTLSLSLNNPNNVGGAILNGTTSVTFANGLTTFTDLEISAAGTYTLHATNGQLSLDSDPFVITAQVLKPAVRLAFGSAPTFIQAGQKTSPAFSVAVLDADGALASTYTGQVNLAIKSGTGSNTNTLTNPTVNVANGVATFTNTAFTASGKDYVLSATADGLTGAESPPITVLPAGTYLRGTLSPDLSAPTGTFEATLTVQNVTGADLAQGTPITFNFNHMPINVKKDVSLSGATWRKLTLRSGTATLDAPLKAGESRSLHLHLTLSGTLKTGWSVQALVNGRVVSNTLRSLTQGAVPLTVKGAKNGGKATASTLLTFSGAGFVPNELLLITVSDTTRLRAPKDVADKHGRIVVKSRRGLPPGTYTVTVYGWYSGITATATITLT